MCELKEKINTKKSRVKEENGLFPNVLCVFMKKYLHGKSFIKHQIIF